MTYKEYLKLDEKPSGKASSKWTAFPLWFAEHDEIIEDVADFSVIDDFMVNNDIDNFSDDFKNLFPDYKIFAMCDSKIATEKNPNFSFDSYAEFFLAIDTSNNENKVLLWTGEGGFEILFDTFTDFWDSLYDWSK